MRRLAAVALAVVVVALMAWPAVADEEWFRFSDPEIDESSGIVLHDGLALTINDSGDSARVFAVDPASGDTVGITTYAEEVTDVEALALTGDGQLLVGDIGDNPRNREFIRLYALPIPTRGDRTVESTAYDLVYEDGPRDAETLLVHPRTGRISIVSKGLLGGSVYEAPRELRSDRTNVLRRVATSPGLITDGIYFPDGEHVLLRNYSAAFVMTASNFAAVARIPLPTQEQGEGITLRDDEMVLSSEGVNAPVLVHPIPPRVLRAMEPEPAPAEEPPVEPERDDDSLPGQEGERDGLVDGPVVPVLLTVAWVLLVALLLRAVRRRWSRAES